MKPLWGDTISCYPNICWMPGVPNHNCGYIQIIADHLITPLKVVYPFLAKTINISNDDTPILISLSSLLLISHEKTILANHG